jgi:hypothetical protein
MQHRRITRLRPDTNGFASMSCATNGATSSPPTFDASDEGAVPVSHPSAQWWESSKAWSP